MYYYFVKVESWCARSLRGPRGLPWPCLCADASGSWVELSSCLNSVLGLGTDVGGSGFSPLNPEYVVFKTTRPSMKHPKGHNMSLVREAGIVGEFGTLHPLHNSPARDEYGGI